MKCWTWGPDDGHQLDDATAWELRRFLLSICQVSTGSWKWNICVSLVGIIIETPCLEMGYHEFLHSSVGKSNMFTIVYPSNQGLGLFLTGNTNVWKTWWVSHHLPTAPAASWIHFHPFPLHQRLKNHGLTWLFLDTLQTKKNIYIYN